MADAAITLTAVDKTQAAIDSAKRNLSGLSSSAAQAAVSMLGFASATGAVAVAYAALTNNSKAVDAFNDLRDTTGASIENISALDRVARETGGTFEGMAATLTKFNGVLNKAGDDSKQAGAVFKALGLDADELKKMDPAEALLKTAEAFQKFELDGNSARAMQVLFGKSVGEVAPLLKDLAEKGKLVATVTAAQAEEAEIFNKALYKMQANSQDAARALSLDLVTGINAAAKAWKESGLLAGIQTLLTGDDQFKNNKRLTELTDELLVLESRVVKQRANLNPNLALQERTQERLDAVKAEIQTVQSYRKLLDQQSPTPNKPKDKLADTKAPKLGKPDHFADNFINQLVTEYANLSGAMSKTEEVTRKLDTSTEKFTATERARALNLANLIDQENAKKQILAAQTGEMQREAAARDASDAAYSRFLVKLLEGNQAQAFEASLIGKTTEEVERLRFERELSLKALEAENQAQADMADGLITEVELRERLAAISRTTTDTRQGRADFVKKSEDRLKDPLAGKEDALREYGKSVEQVAIATHDVWANAFKGMEDVLTDFVKTGKLDFKGLVDSIMTDLIRIQIRQTITGPLSQALSGSGGAAGGGIGGGLFSGLFSSFFGGGVQDAATIAGVEGLVPGFEGGGDTGSGLRTGGLDGKGGFMAMLHPQETVLDHTRGQSANDGGGTVINNYHYGSNVSRAEVYEASRSARVAAVNDVREGQRRRRG